MPSSARRAGRDVVDLHVEAVCEEDGCRRPAADVVVLDGHHRRLCQPHRVHLDMTVAAVLRTGVARPSGPRPS